MPENKNAVVVGKVELKPRREVVVGPKADQNRRPQFQAKKQAEPRPKQMKRADDTRASAAANQAMLQELQYVKKQLREAQEQRDQALTSNAIFAAEVKRLVTASAFTAEVQNDQIELVPTPEYAEALATVKKSLGL